MNTPHLSLPYIAAGQAQKHVTYNEALQKLDALIHIAVESKTVINPPSNPTQGARYLIPVGATGVWAGQPGKIASFDSDGWQFYEPRAGWILWVASDLTPLVHNGTMFVNLISVETLPQLGINATADATNRLNVQSAASLFDHSGGSHQMKINKGATGNNATALFQTAYSGRAEIGLAGDDGFSIKVSANGSSWISALKFDPATGNIGINTPPTATEKMKVRADQNALSQIAIENYSTDAQASSGLSVFAGNGNYFRTQLYSSSVLYASTSAAFYLGTYAATGLYLRTNSVDRLSIGPDGRVSIGTSSFSARLSVDGAIRPKSYTITNLPSATTQGVGALIHVSNDASGPTMAYSDGSVWRRIYDRTAVI
jgi:hypothetical protein